MIRVNSTGNHESTSKDLSPVQKPNDFIAQVERSMKANSGEIAAESPDVLLQIRLSSDERNEVGTTGECSPGRGVHLTETSHLFDGEISGDINSGKVTGVLGDDGDEVLPQKTPCIEDNIPKVTKPLIKQQINVYSSSNLQGQVTATNDDHNSEETLEPVRITCILNQQKNQDMEHISNHSVELMKHDREKSSIKETTERNVLRQMQGDENAATKHTQESQHTNTKAITRASQEKQQVNGGKAIWKVKDKKNPNENAMQQSKEYGGTQTNSTTKEMAVQTQQAKTSHMQQTIQKTRMISKTPVIEIEESGDQIAKPPSPVIVDIEDLCVENEVPSPVTPLVVTAEVFEGRMAVKEKNTNLQEGEPMGRELSHVLHENQTADPRNDLPAPATTTNAAQLHQK
uniref:Uncharacterized protein n=1 Tax=Solanum tuberosum TaxID=4113 RepID=M1DER2_SOLTU